MATAEAFLVDTNVLLEATDERRRHHEAARALVESPNPLVFPAQVIREYLAVATRPISANGLGMSTTDALENIRQFRIYIRLLSEEKPILPAFLKLIETVPCRGKRIHDAHLVATTMVHRIRTIVSLNADDLAPFAGAVAIITPSQALQRRQPVRPSATRRSPRRSRHRS
jgi:predicted nucleic acid-binding protein